MTLPTTQNCCEENGSSNSGRNPCHGIIGSSKSAGVELMDLMMTATPPDAPQCNGDQASRGCSSDENNNEILSVPSTRMPSEDDDQEMEEEQEGRCQIINNGASITTIAPKTKGGAAVTATTTTTTVASFEDDDSDMFGPPRSTPLLNTNRPRVPMISAKLRLREERKRVLQLCANKLEKIKDSETNLRRSVCINNTYSRLTEEVRREKQSRYMANLPKCDSRTNSGTTSDRHRCCRLTMPNQPATTCFNHCCDERRVPPMHDESHPSSQNNNSSHRFRDQTHRPPTPINPPATTPVRPQRRRSQVETDLETLDREINALDAAMPPIDPEITQGAEQLEKAVVSRKRTRMEACLETDRFLALSQFYFPSPRLLSCIDDPPGMDGLIKRQRLLGPSFDSALDDFDLNLDHHNQREFEVIMDTLRFGPTIAGGNTELQACNATTAPDTDSCGHAAMRNEQCNGGGFNNLEVY